MVSAAQPLAVVMARQRVYGRLPGRRVFCKLHRHGFVLNRPTHRLRALFQALCRFEFRKEQLSVVRKTYAVRAANRWTRNM